MIKKLKNYIIYDIEADGVDFSSEDEYGYYKPVGKEQIFSISYKGYDMNNADCLIIGVDGIVNEKDLLTRFSEIASEYEVLIGHNNIRFDDVLLLERMKVNLVQNHKIRHLLQNDDRLDTIEIAQLLNYGKPYGKSLNGLAKELDLPVSKEDINPVTTFHEGKLDLLAKYNNRDVELTQMILLKIKGLEMVNELMELTGCNPKEVTRKAKILGAFIRNNDYPIQSNKKLKKTNSGGFNFYRDRGDTGVKYNKYYSLIHIDVSSMYPSLIILIGADSSYDYPNYNQKTGKILPFKETKESGSIAKITKFFVDKRHETKAERDKYVKGSVEYDRLDRKQQALKILCNSIYGACNVDYFVMCNRKLGSLITALGRDILNACIKQFDACYAKTDSVWISNKYNVDEVNNFVTKYLKDKYNLDNKDGILRFELENNVDTLIAVDKNDYVEITENGKYNYAGAKFNPFSNGLSEFEYDISIKYAVNSESINTIDDFIESKLKEPLSYFAKLENISANNLHHAKNNTAWLEANDYYFTIPYQYNHVFTKYGYIVYDHIVPKIPISPEYVKFLAYNHLFNLGLIDTKPDDDYKRRFIPLVPTLPKKQDNGKYRFIPNKKLIAEKLDIKNSDNFSGWEFYSKFNLSNIESDYKGLLCTRNTGYFFLDIDKDVDNWNRRLKKPFTLKARHWTTTRSDKTHIILKTDVKENINIFDIKLNTDEVELKTNELVPLYNNGEYGDYSPLQGTKPLADIQNISYDVLVSKLQSVGLLDSDVIVKPVEKPLDTSNIVEVNDLKDIINWVNQAIRLYNENKDILSSNTYFMALGNQLKRYLIRDNILKVLDNINYDRELLNKTKNVVTNNTGYKTGLQNSFKNYTESDKTLYYTLKEHNNKLKSLLGIERFNLSEIDYDRLDKKPEVNELLNTYFNINNFVVKVNDKNNELILKEVNRIRKGFSFDESFEFHFFQKPLKLDFNNKENIKTIKNFKLYCKNVEDGLLKGFKYTDTYLDSTNRERAILIRDFKENNLYPFMIEFKQLYEDTKQDILKDVPILSFKELVELYKVIVPNMFIKTEQEIIDKLVILLKIGIPYNVLLEILAGSGVAKGATSNDTTLIYPNVMLESVFTEKVIINRCINDPEYYNGQTLLIEDIGANAERSNVQQYIGAVEVYFKTALSQNYTKYSKTDENNKDEVAIHMITDKGFNLVHMAPRSVVNLIKDDGQVKARTEQIHLQNNIETIDDALDFMEIDSDTESLDYNIFKLAWWKFIDNIKPVKLTRWAKKQILLTYQENSERIDNKHFLKRIKILEAYLLGAYGEDYYSWRFKPLYLDNIEKRGKALELLEVITKHAKPIKRDDYNWKDLQETNQIAKNKYSLTNKSQYLKAKKCTGFTITALKGLQKRSTIIKKYYSELPDLIFWLVENNYLYYDDKIDGKNVYVLLEQETDNN